MRRVPGKLVGKVVEITDKESIYYKEWGIVKDFDREIYYIAIANGTDSIPVFNRDQFKVMKGEIAWQIIQDSK